jgi:hypothetical protein
MCTNQLVTTSACAGLGFIASWADSNYFDEWYDNEFKK